MKTIIIIIGLFLSTSAISSEYYFGGGVDSLFFDNEYNIEKASIGSMYAIFGNAHNKYLSLEGRAGIGIKDDEIKIVGVDIERKLKSYYGLYLKGTLPITDIFQPYILVGYSGGEHEISTMHYTRTFFESSTSYGAGMSAKFKKLAVNLEYINYFNVKDAKISGFGISLIRFF